jgi:hypothetical protein
MLKKELNNENFKETKIEPEEQELHNKHKNIQAI